RGWDDRWETYSEWAEKGQALKDELLTLVDKDTQSFEAVMAAFRIPKGTEAEKTQRSVAIQAATKAAIAVPYRVMEVVSAIFPLCEAMAEMGLRASASDAGVGALCARAAVRGAYLNVQINAAGLTDTPYKHKVLSDGQALVDAADAAERKILTMVA
ncbi:MAG: cyclodeaminase/cyclohydrolase family protein, partial [Bacteroidota bacterium]